MTTKAIVIGASMAGLVTARVLSDHVDEVEVLERDRLADTPEVRRGVPQGRHAHAILAAGERLIEGWFPGIGAELQELGAVRVGGEDAWWYQGGGYRVRGDWGGRPLCASRPLLETTVRRRLVERANVVVRDRVSVERLRLVDGRVTGVVVDGAEHAADLVVDCSGRHSRFLDQLADAGFPAPPVSNVRIDMAYGTRLLERRPGDFAGSFAIVAPTPPDQWRVGVLLPIEGDRWILTLAGLHGDTPPTDDAGFLAFARSLPTPVLADLLERAEALTPVMSHRLPSSQRRHIDKVRRWPRGFLILGDAVCSFNPIYGQGMSSAALQANALHEVLARHGVHASRLARAFGRRAAKVVTNPWTIAVGADFSHPSTTGPKPAGTDMVNRYVHKVLLATHVSLPVQRKMIRVQELLAPPQSLMAPATMARVLWAARRSPVHTGHTGHPAPAPAAAAVPQQAA